VNTEKVGIYHNFVLRSVQYNVNKACLHKTTKCTEMMPVYWEQIVNVGVPFGVHKPSKCKDPKNSSVGYFGMSSIQPYA